MQLKIQKCPWCGESIEPIEEGKLYETPTPEQKEINKIVERAGFDPDQWIAEPYTSAIRVDVYEHCVARWYVGPNGVIIKTLRVTNAE